MENLLSILKKLRNNISFFLFNIKLLYFIFITLIAHISVFSSTLISENDWKQENLKGKVKIYQSFQCENGTQILFKEIHFNFSGYKTQQIFFDQSGNRTQTTTFFYNEKNNLTEIQKRDLPFKSIDKEIFIYNARGLLEKKLTSKVENQKNLLVSENHYFYNKSNQLIKENILIYTENKISEKKEITYQYYTEKSLFVKEKNLITEKKKHITKYNSQGKIVESLFTEDGNNILQEKFQYNKENLLIEEINYNRNQFQDKKSYFYNEKNQLNHLINYDIHSKILEKVEYTYQENLFILERKHYSENNQLTLRIHYKYDEVGNTIEVIAYQGNQEVEAHTLLKYQYYE